MIKKLFAGVTCLTVTLAFGACSSDDGGSKSNGQGDGSTGGGSGDSGKLCEQITTDPKFSKTQCNNKDDRCYLETHQAEVRQAGGACATSTACLAYISTPDDPAAVKCVTDCMTPKLANALSVACEECSQKVAACGARHCVAECVSAPDSAECTTCLCKSYAGELGGKGGNCLIDVFADCAGFAPTAAMVGCTGASAPKDSGLD